jgi:protein SCO1/2
VVFVSVDPERDTPAIVRDYVHGFDPTFRGITGSVEGIDAFARELGIAHRKVPMGEDQYAVDHTAAVLVLDPQARNVAVFTPPFEAAGLSSDIGRLIAASAGAG